MRNMRELPDYEALNAACRRMSYSMRNSGSSAPHKVRRRLALQLHLDGYTYVELGLIFGISTSWAHTIVTQAKKDNTREQA